MVSAHIATNILALIKITIMHILLHSFIAHVRRGPHDNTGPTGLISVIKDVCISNVLSVDAATALDHWQLLRVQVFVGI